MLLFNTTIVQKNILSYKLFGKYFETFFELAVFSGFKAAFFLMNKVPRTKHNR